MNLITAPGFYPQLIPDDYFAEPCPAPALTNSGIGTLLASCPARFAFEHPALGDGSPERQSTAAQHRGSLVHRLALGKGADYAVIDAPDYRTKEAKVAKAEAEASGLIPVLADKLTEAQAMAAVISDQIEAVVNGADYQTEVVIAWFRGDRWCRAMLDVWCPSRALALDVKTCADASDDAVRRAFARGYGRQEAWYRDGLTRLTGTDARFAFLFVESDPPHLSREATATEGMRTGSRMDCERGFSIFDRCMKAGEWPSYTPMQVEPTPWQVREWTEAEYLEAA